MRRNSGRPTYYTGRKIKPEPRRLKTLPQYSCRPHRATEEEDWDWEVWRDETPIAHFYSTVECSEFIRAEIAKENKNNPYTPIDKDSHKD